MFQKRRLRVFAGPNGSGKTSLFERVKRQYRTGFWINADCIEKEISEKGFINIEEFNLHLKQSDFELFCRLNDAVSLITKLEKLGQQINICIKNNIIVHQSKKIYSYEAALIASFIREKLRESDQTFSFETVMSHVSKLEEMKTAKERGYRIYLYFVCLDTPEMSMSRVQNRTEKGGHLVDTEKITDRYYRTLDNLIPAITLTNRTYLFDNSDSMKLIAEVHEGNLSIRDDELSLPDWFIHYVVNKIST
jgi:predicted ABC-type ATPase